jgi:hypothetical protein
VAQRRLTSHSLQPATHWLVFFRPARHALSQAPFGPSLFTSPDALARDSRSAWRFDLFSAQPVQQLASPPRITAVLRAGGASRPPHLIVTSYHVLVYLPVLHSLGSASRRTSSLLLDAPSEVIERHRCNHSATGAMANYARLNVERSGLEDSADSAKVPEPVTRRR